VVWHQVDHQKGLLVENSSVIKVLQRENAAYRDLLDIGNRVPESHITTGGIEGGGSEVSVVA